LISSYKHILASNKDEKGNSSLTPDEKGRLAGNFTGYDISPDMVRLSLVNMYLHGFADPHIYEYDTLTSQDRWNEDADVILANPPFMSPKGGIRPHNRFSVQSKRSEVLFVDYMAEHLTPSGRAGIIVPEGIIFQSQTAYKQLRKMLVEEYLVAVVSLPAGVFNPYSGVKTSILILDKSLAKKANTIAFFKVENDGLGLGAQRREINKNDLPQARAEIGEYLRRLRAGESLADFQPTLGLIVEKEKIAANGDYNLSGERYREEVVTNSGFPHALLRDVSKVITKGTTPTTAGFNFEESGINFIKIESVSADGTILSSKLAHISQEAHAAFARSQLQAGDVLFSIAGAMGRSAVVDSSLLPANTNQALAIIRAREGLVLPAYLSHLLRSSQVLAHVDSIKAGVAQYNVSLQQVGDIEIPLPPLEVQKEIVAEIEGHQRVINGARAVLDSYRPHIPIDPDWPTVAIEDLVADAPHSMKAGPFGSSLKKEFYVPSGYKIYGQEQVIRGDAKFGDYYISEEKYRELESCKVKAGDVLISLVGTYGKTLIVPDDHEPGIINPRLLKLTLNPEKMAPTFFVAAFAQESVMSQVHGMSYGGTMDILSLKVLKSLRIPLPPLATQQAIVAEIEAEQALVAANRELIARFEKKIQATLARVWGEDEPAPAEA
ncbi:MAG: N-6 DNA methylase, partial [Chloroflexi bacterium]|nr:N-6 DNA methylase [Chloroflexota bacterium]